MNEGRSGQATGLPADPPTGLLIGGRWQEGAKRPITVLDPATGAALAEVANGGADDAVSAVDAAHAALTAWAAATPRARSEVLRTTYELIRREAEALARLISAENGKSSADAQAEVRYSAEFFRWFSEEAVRPGGTYGEAPTGGTRNIVTHRPVGVAALVSPWNFPAAMAARKLAPALAAGCTTVLKPASETPLTALAIAALMLEAGAPAGVVNVVVSDDPGAVVGTWLDDSRVRKISFTGSTRVGQMLLEQASRRVVNASMELGGNAPFVVTPGADIDRAVNGAITAKFRNGGQACTAANTFYVHADVLAPFVERFVKKTAELTVGPAGESSDIGPLISRRAVNTVTSVVERAIEQGAQVAYQGDLITGAGFYYPPTILTDVKADADITATEIFGPVAPIVAWTDQTKMLDAVNAGDAGLAAYVFADDLQHGLQLGESIEAGMVGINRGLVSDPSAPFGGMNQSGLGREGARIGMEEYLETQYLSVDWPN